MQSVSWLQHVSFKIFSFQESETSLRRAHSEELLSEVGVDNDQHRSASRSSSSNKTSRDSGGLLQVSDHPRMRHNSADNADTENNYENFAHELSNTYLWSPVMTNTRDLTNHDKNANTRLVQVDLNSTNSDSNMSHRSDLTPNAGLLSVNSRPSSSVSPERRLDMVLGADSIQFSDQNPGFKQMARPIPTFNSFGIHEDVHRARPAYAPTPSPGGSEDSAPPLPARQQQNNQQQQPHSLPFFPFHQFPGRSVKPMRKFNRQKSIEFPIKF